MLSTFDLPTFPHNYSYIHTTTNTMPTPLLEQVLLNPPVSKQATQGLVSSRGFPDPQYFKAWHGLAWPGLVLALALALASA